MRLKRTILLSLCLFIIPSLYPVDLKTFNGEYISPVWKIALFGAGAIPVWYWAKSQWQSYAEDYAQRLLEQIEKQYHSIDETLTMFDAFIEAHTKEPHFNILLSETIKEAEQTINKLTSWSGYLPKEDLPRFISLTAKLYEFKTLLSQVLESRSSNISTERIKGQKPRPEQIQALYQSEKPVIVDIYSTYCPPCKKMAPIFDQVAREQSDNYTFIKANIDDSDDFTEEFDIEVVPTIIFIQNGEVVHKHKGALNRQELLTLISQVFE